MVYSNRPLFKDPSGFLPGSRNKVDGGTTVTIPNGYDQHGKFHDEAGTLSIQPNGDYQWRPLGSAGAYEVAQEAGDKLVYSPAPDKVFVIATVGV